MSAAKPGDRVRAVYVEDGITRVKPGDKGTVTRIDALGTVDIRWDDGHDLGLIPGVDDFEILEDGDE